MGGSPPWDVATVVDNQPVLAWGYAETTDQINDAPTLELTQDGPTWVAGIIGDTRVRGAGGATNDVDFYRLELPGNDHYAVRLDVLAQRFGSSLDAAVSLFDSQGQLLASNDDALQISRPTDANLYAGLDSGTYFIAVSAGGNLPGVSSGFDPKAPGSGQASRGTTGPYLLRIDSESDTTHPEVEEIRFGYGQSVGSPPTTITVRFNEEMDLAGLETGATLVDSTGNHLAISPLNYDSGRHEVSYLLLVRPSAGDYEFELHAGLVRDRADNPLDGGGPNGDYVANLHVEASSIVFADNDSNETPETAQPLGPLYQQELRDVVRITGNVTPLGSIPAGVDHDFYRFEVLQTTLFRFRFSPGSPVETGVLSLHDAAGNLIVQATAQSASGATLLRFLQPGVYLVQMTTTEGAERQTYQLMIQAAEVLDVPLMDNDAGFSVQVVLRVKTEVEQTPANTESSSPSASITITVSSTQMAATVNSLPPVGSQPIGTPRAESADSSELAWTDQSPASLGLPAGFALRGEPRGPATQFSVRSVSGSFLDSLPDAVPHGTYPLSPSATLVRELAQLTRNSMDGNWASRGDASSDSDLSLSADFALPVAQGGAASSAVEAGTSPSSLSLGVVATLGFASSLTVPNRRHSNNWVQRAFQLLGLA